jgi:hypothetical protein
MNANIKAMVEASDRREERRERQDAERIAAGLSEPVYHWTPPDGTKDIFGRPLKPKRQKRTST